MPKTAPTGPQLPPELAEHADPFGPIGGPDPQPVPAAPAEPEPEAPAAPEPLPIAAAPSEPAPPSDLTRVLEQNNRLIDALVTRAPSHAAQTAAPPPLPQRPEGPPPNPAVDPEGFNTWFQQNEAYREAKHRRELDAVRSETQEQTLAQTLWTEIRTDAETRELAQHSWLFEQAFRDLGGRIDGDPQDFKRRVVERARERADALRGGAPAAPAPGPTSTPAPAAPAQPNRTAGLSGGSAPGVTTPTRKGGQGGAPEVVDLVDEIHRMQENDPMGYFAYR